MGFELEIERRTMGRELQDCRKEANLTQRQFAEKVGVAMFVVVKWETGRRRFYADEFFSICHALGWDEEKFMRRLVSAAEEARRKQKRPKLGEED